jgi:hypothetical protein
LLLASRVSLPSWLLVCASHRKVISWNGNHVILGKAISSDSYEWFDVSHLDLPLPLPRICFNNPVQAWQSCKAFLPIEPIWRPSRHVNIYYRDTFYSLDIQIMVDIQIMHKSYLELIQESSLLALQKSGNVGSVLTPERTAIAINAVYFLFTISRGRSIPHLGPPAATFLSCHRWKKTTQRHPITFHPHSQNLECKSFLIVVVLLLL